MNAAVVDCNIDERKFCPNVKATVNGNSETDERLELVTRSVVEKSALSGQTAFSIFCMVLRESYTVKIKPDEDKIPYWLEAVPGDFLEFV